MPPSPSSSSKLITPIKWAIGSWSFFIAENVILSENRTFLINDVLQGNDDYYHYMYGLFSTTAVGSIVYAYYGRIVPFQIQKENIKYLLWDSSKNTKIPFYNRIMAFSVLSLGIGFMSQTAPKLQIPVEYTSINVTDSSSSSSSSSSSRGNDDTKMMPSSPAAKAWKVRCPFDFTDSKTKQHLRNHQPLTINDIHGMDRITRHPGLWSFGLIGLGTSFLSPCIPTRIYLSMPMLMAWIGGHHQDSRFRRGIGGVLEKDFDRLTSNVPFWALVMGEQSSDRMKLLRDLWEKEVKGLNFMLSMAAAALFVARRGR